MTHLTGARRYRLKIYDGEHELLARQHHEVVVDLDSDTWQNTVAAALAPLLRQVKAAGEYADAPRLVVCDLETERHLRDWAA